MTNIRFRLHRHAIGRSHFANTHGLKAATAVSATVHPHLIKGSPSKYGVQLFAAGGNFHYPLSVMAQLNSGDESRYRGLDQAYLLAQLEIFAQWLACAS